MNCAIYARVSTERCIVKSCGHPKSQHLDGKCACQRAKCACGEYKGQKTDMQLTDLREYVKRAGWESAEYIETESSMKLRPVFERMLKDARLRKFEVVLVWKIDRFARSMKQFIDVVLDLDAVGVSLTSITQNISTSARDPMGQFVVRLLALLAELEHAIIVERTKAGVAEARLQGKHCGRPAKVFHRDRAVAMRNQVPPLSWRKIAQLMGIPQATLRRALAGVSKV